MESRVVKSAGAALDPLADQSTRLGNLLIYQRVAILVADFAVSEALTLNFRSVAMLGDYRRFHGLSPQFTRYDPLTLIGVKHPP
jgi:hypothetical protein